jgi:hypothetical protein
MTGNCIIDNKNVYAAYGAFIVKGGYDELLLFPPLKKPEMVDWPDENGIDVDLTAPRLEAREVQIPFVLGSEDPSSFVSFLERAGYRVVYIPILGEIFPLRYVSASSLALYKGLSSITIRMAQDDYPDPTDNLPATPLVPSTGYLLDNEPVEHYGLMISGKEERLMPAAMKKSLSFTAKDWNVPGGQFYDTGAPRKSSREMVFNCRFKLETADDFRRARWSLLHTLLQPGGHTISIGSANYYGYYTKCSQGKVVTLSGQYVYDFKLTFTII